MKEKIKRLIEGFRQGDYKTRLSYIIMGSGSFLRGQYAKGFMYLFAQIVFNIYFFLIGVDRLKGLKTLGTTVQGKVWDEAKEIYIYSQGDNSMLFLLFGVLALMIVIAFVLLYFRNINLAIENQKLLEEGKTLPKFRDDVIELFDSKFHVTILFLPTVLTFLFTILPLIFMILIAFTNYDKNHQPPGNLFSWVGLTNFKNMFYGNPLISKTFFSLLSWTFVWAFFATFFNYILGMLLAMLINKKGIRLKKMWRTIFVITIAVPQFVTLLLMSQLLHELGPVNVLLQSGD